MEYKGIDISHYQGAIDPNKVSNAVDFVILKLSENQSKDSRFELYYQTLKKPLGAYIFNRAKNEAMATNEANFAVKQLDGRKLACGVWLDMEAEEIRKLGKSMITKIINKEASILKKAGYSVGVYCNLSWYNTVIDASIKKDYPIWVARYPSGDNGTIKDSLSPKGNTGVVMWQYSSKGRVNGITGNVDMDLAFTDIPKLMSGTTPQPTPQPTTGIVIPMMNIVKGNNSQFDQIVKNIKLALNTDYGLKFNVNDSTVDDVLLINLGNVVLSTKTYKRNITYSLQQLLRWWGFTLGIDGEYGQETANTVLNFQTCFGFMNRTNTTTREFWYKVLGK